MRRREAALANKYGAMLTPTSDSIKRVQDGVDFASMVRHSTDEGSQPIDLGTLEALGELVWPGGGGKEILHLVKNARREKYPICFRHEGPGGNARALAHEGRFHRAAWGPGGS